jgi:LacI family transcriptional regulator
MLAGDDEIAYGLYRSLRRLGVKIPGDISLIGFDDRELAALLDPPLTTVRVDSQEIGRCCIKLLFEGLHKASKSVSTHLVPTKLMERESVQWYVPTQAKIKCPTVKLLTTEGRHDAQQQA